jgi:hypothetical protein
VRRALRVAALLLLLASAAAVPVALARRERPASLPAALEAPRLSLLAVGDTGKRHRLIASAFEGQLAVAEGMEDEDRRAPVQALVFLGDNFYMEGLEEQELVERIRENLVLPYCRFLALTGPRSAEVASACAAPAPARRPPPILAVLGNHDVVAPESPRLEREAIPLFVPNWRLAERPEHVELGEGVCLVTYDSAVSPPPGMDDALAAALRSCRGPWRILASHRPIAIDEEAGPGGPPPWLAAALEKAGVAVQVHLAGHHHSLQLIRGGPPGPSLHVVAGSGARTRPLRRSHPGRLFGAEQNGFARVDLVGSGARERLVVTLFGTPAWPVLAWSPPSALASWSVDRSGELANEAAAAHP